MPDDMEADKQSHPCIRAPTQCRSPQSVKCEVRLSWFIWGDKREMEEFKLSWTVMLMSAPSVAITAATRPCYRPGSQ